MRRRRARSRVPRIGFYGVLGSGNIGNDASLDVVVQHLRQEMPEAELGFFAMGYQELARRYAAPTTPLQWYEAHRDRLRPVPDVVLKIIGRLLDPFRTWWWVRRHDVVLVAGMGILETTVPGKAWGSPFGLLCLAVASRITGTWFGLVCVGAEIDGDPVIRWMLRSTASLAQYRSYRDLLSRDAMRDLGVQVADDEVYPDLVFGMTVPMPHRQPLLIGVGVMNFRGRSTNPARAAATHDQYRRRITEVVQRLTADGWRVRLLIGDVEDIPVAEGIRSEVSMDDDTSRPAVELAVTETIDELLAQLAQTQVFIGTRYHNVLAALALGTPTLSVGYARKNRELMEAFGLGGCCQEAHLLDVELTLDQVRDAVENHDTLSRLIRDRLPDMRHGVHDQLRALSEELQPLRRPVEPA